MRITYKAKMNRASLKVIDSRDRNIATAKNDEESHMKILRDQVELRYHLLTTQWPPTAIDQIVNSCIK